MLPEYLCWNTDSSMLARFKDNNARSIQDYAYRFAKSNSTSKWLWVDISMPMIDIKHSSKDILFASLSITSASWLIDSFLPFLPVFHTSNFPPLTQESDNFTSVHNRKHYLKNSNSATLLKQGVPGFVHPPSKALNTYQYPCKIPCLSYQVHSPRLAHYHWYIQMHASKSLLMAPIFLSLLSKNRSG